MKRLLFALVILNTIVISVLLYYYLKKTNTTKSPYWPEVADDVLSNCAPAPKRLETQEFIDYTSQLFKAVGGDMVYDSNSKSFLSLSGQNFALGPIKINPRSGSPIPAADQCVIVWVGQQGGIGNVAYYNTRGKVRKIKIIDFPNARYAR